MAAKKGVMYFKMVVSYGDPTEFDDAGCDGMFIESVEKTNEVAELKALLIRLRNFVVMAEGHWLFGERWTDWVDPYLPNDELIN